jgi:hypothetical protein
MSAETWPSLLPIAPIGYLFRNQNLVQAKPKYFAVPERTVKQMRKSKGRRKVGRKKRRMRAKIRHRK